MICNSTSSWTKTLRRSGTTLSFGTVASGGIANNAVTLAKLATQADQTILANISGGVAVPTAATLTAVLDDILGTTQGAVMYRNATVWTTLGPGTSGQFLQTLGAGANPQWVTGGAGTGTVTNTGGALTANAVVLGAGANDSNSGECG